MSFETNPLPPERIVKLSMPLSVADKDSPVVLDNPMLSVGIQIITDNGSGLKVVPHKAIVFAFGTQAHPEQQKLDMPSSMARGMAQRIIEMCDVIEGKRLLTDDLELPLVPRSAS